jgi:ferritin
MALAERMERALNDQITRELSASLAYLQMAAHFEAEERPGMATWMAAQSGEEAVHARMFIDYVVDRDGRVEIGAIDAPVSKFDSPLHVFEEALRHERAVTEEIRSLYRLASELDDLESLPFLQGFLVEQVEEEALVSGICERIGRLEGSEVGLALIEAELGARTAEGEE